MSQASGMSLYQIRMEGWKALTDRLGPAGAMRFRSQEFMDSFEGQLLLVDGSQRFQRLFDMTDPDIDDITAFLETISKP